MIIKFKYFFVLIISFLINCNAVEQKLSRDSEIIPAAGLMNRYSELLEGKTIAVVANHTSLIGKTHLVDTLREKGINVVKVFSPEHGFRGSADAGEHVGDYIDKKTGLEVISLYGKNMKPKPVDLHGVDLILFDLQDVGVRFYTYISTMHYVMEACAEQAIQCIVLDRPNPNGHYIDGPVLDTSLTSFVGIHPVPVVYGMTIGELATMINGERWLNNGVICDLKVIRCKNYNHSKFYELPVNPSPNLKSMQAIYLYPSLGLFEGTVMSVGRGTDNPFEKYGHPSYSDSVFSFVPRSIIGASRYPKYEGERCYGKNLANYPIKKIPGKSLFTLRFLLDAYKKTDMSDRFFNKFFFNLSGSYSLKDQIINGIPLAQIHQAWQHELNEFKQLRKKYLLYEDF